MSTSRRNFTIGACAGSAAFLIPEREADASALLLTLGALALAGTIVRAVVETRKEKKKLAEQLESIANSSTCSHTCRGLHRSQLVVNKKNHSMVKTLHHMRDLGSVGGLISPDEAVSVAMYFDDSDSRGDVLTPYAIIEGITHYINQKGKLLAAQKTALGANHKELARSWFDSLESELKSKKHGVGASGLSFPTHLVSKMTYGYVFVPSIHAPSQQVNRIMVS